MKFLIISMILCSSVAIAAQLPRRLTESDRLETLKVLGFGSSAKINSDPTPLGGFQGFEFFISNEVIPIDTVQKLGDRSGQGEQIMMTTIGFGKGIFYDIDTFVFYTPLQIQNKISQFGGFFRKRLYADDQRPWQVSMSLIGGGTTYENLITMTTTCLDFIFHYQWPHVSFGAGFGQGRSIGTFIGGASGINSTNETFTEDLQQRHWLVTGSYRWDKTYLSFQYDRFFENTYAAKLGYRF